MRIDPTTLTNMLRRKDRKPSRLKATVKRRIKRDVKAHKATDLYWICEKTGLSPQHGRELYQLLYDQIELPDKAEPNLTTKGLEGLVLKETEVEPLPGGYRLHMDPLYTWRIMVVSDTHIGNVCDNIPGLHEAYDRAASLGIQEVYHPGDVVDGDPNRHSDGHRFVHPLCHGYEGQLDRVLEHYPQREGITTYFVAGNHDQWFWNLPGADICRQIHEQREDMVYLKEEGKTMVKMREDLTPEQREVLYQSHYVGSGRIGAVRTGPPGVDKNTFIMLMHPGSGSANTISYKPQTIMDSVDQICYSFEDMKWPDMLLLGHYHKSSGQDERGTIVIQAGTMKLADQFHEVRSLKNMMGYWILELTSKPNGRIEQCRSRFQRPYIEPGMYTRNAIPSRTLRKAA